MAGRLTPAGRRRRAGSCNSNGSATRGLPGSLAPGAGAPAARAPVTDWRLYDTHYTERYLGTPQDDPEAYERSSVLADASRLERPLMLIHGMADDNAVSAHTLRLSS